MRMLSKYTIMISSTIRFLKNTVYYSLEYNKAISHTKEYYQKLKEPTVSMKYSLLLIFKFDLHIIETPENI